ncbi:MAG: hypothetical protein WDN25_04385 [Acetobacteraceae bacterium]
MRLLLSRMERVVDNIHTASHAAPRAFEEVQESVQEDAAHYAPAEFLRQFGVVVAVCLALAVLAQVLVAMVGEY